MLYALGLMILRNNLIQRFNLVFEQGLITISFACKKRDSNLVMIATTAMATRYSIFHQTQKMEFSKYLKLNVDFLCIIESNA